MLWSVTLFGDFPAPCQPGIFHCLYDADSMTPLDVPIVGWHCCCTAGTCAFADLSGMPARHVYWYLADHPLTFPERVQAPMLALLTMQDQAACPFVLSTAGDQCSVRNT